MLLRPNTRGETICLLGFAIFAGVMEWDNAQNRRPMYLSAVDWGRIADICYAHDRAKRAAGYSVSTAKATEGDPFNDCMDDEKYKIRAMGGSKCDEKALRFNMRCRRD